MTSETARWTLRRIRRAVPDGREGVRVRAGGILIIVY
jgi:hypothetical protein